MLDIETFIDNKSDLYEQRKERRKTKNDDGIASNEFFTPYRIVEKLCNNIPSETWADPTKTFVEPCFGSGNILLVILYKRIAEYNIPWKTALQTLYGLELMPDNVQETRDRVHALLRQISPNYVISEADLIMDHNFVCHDFFTWDFINWREMTPDEIQEITKKNKKKKHK